MLNKNLFTIGLFLLAFFVQGQAKYEVITPPDYSSSQSFPLFIVLHGGNSNKEDMIRQWKSEKLLENFVVVYMEASTLDNRPNRWGWRNFKNEKINIRSYYEKVVSTFYQTQL